MRRGTSRAPDLPATQPSAVAYVAELKIDGLSIALTYEDGRLRARRDARRRHRAARTSPPTSGRFARFRCALRGARRPAGRIEVRGEVYLPRASFERINRELEDAGEPLFANARNTAAGTMRNLDPALVSKRELGAFVYQLVEAASAGLEACRASSPDGLQLTRRHAETLTALASWGLPVEPHWRRCANIDEVVAFCAEWADKRQALDFDTDGVVDQGRRSGAARAARRDGEVPALGDRLQVSRRSRRRPR